MVGASGIVGRNLAIHLAGWESGWTVFGLARQPVAITECRQSRRTCWDPSSLRSALYQLNPTHVYLSTWLRQPTDAENIRVNSQMIRNLLDVLSPKKSVEHVALVTGLKH